jgi:membrane-associated protease RseP (regulator of RpoE activity)
MVQINFRGRIRIVKANRLTLLSWAIVLFLTGNAVGLSAPIPALVKEQKPDPCGRGYIGFYPVSSDSLVISSISPGPNGPSPAQKAMLLAGDRFVEVGTIKPENFEQLREYVSNLRPGTKIKVIVERNGMMLTKFVRLDARPSDSSPYQIVDE